MIMVDPKGMESWTTDKKIRKFSFREIRIRYMTWEPEMS
jgi:hypothetical protein